MRKQCRLGQRYGRLTVLSEPYRAPDGKIVVEVRCDCGTRKTVREYSVRSRDTVSCGCVRRENARRWARTTVLPRVAAG